MSVNSLYNFMEKETLKKCDDLSGSLPWKIIQGKWQQWTNILQLFLNSAYNMSDLVITSVLPGLPQPKLARW